MKNRSHFQKDLQIQNITIIEYLKNARRRKEEKKKSCQIQGQENRRKKKKMKRGISIICLVI